MGKFEDYSVVVCISDNFPVIKEYGGSGKEAKVKPFVGEVLVVDEILGDFLRFDKYDTEEGFNWWKSDRFRLASSEDVYKDHVRIMGKVLQ